VYSVFNAVHIAAAFSQWLIFRRTWLPTLTMMRSLAFSDFPSLSGSIFELESVVPSPVTFVSPYASSLGGSNRRTHQLGCPLAPGLQSEPSYELSTTRNLRFCRTYQFRSSFSPSLKHMQSNLDCSDTTC